MKNLVNLFIKVEYTLFNFQIITFFLQLLFWIVFSGICIFNPILLCNIKDSKKTYSSYSSYSSYSNYSSFSTLNSNKKSKKYKIANIFGRVLWGVIGIIIFIGGALPSLLDIPVLVKQDYSYVTGRVNDVKTERRDLDEYVYINGEKLNVFLFSNIEKNKLYKIGYLPNTSRIVYGIKFEDGSLKVEEKLGFSYSKFLFVLGTLVAFIILFMLTLYLYYKLKSLFV